MSVVRRPAAVSAWAYASAISAAYSGLPDCTACSSADVLSSWRGEPLGRPPVQGRDLVAVLVAQLAAQVLGEQVVEAEPLAVVVEPEQAEVVALDAAQQLRAVRAAADRVAQPGADRLADARAQQQLADLVGLRGEELLGQVAAELRGAPGEAGDVVGVIAALAQHERGELQDRRPALGPLVEARHELGREPLAEDVREQLLGLRRGEAQLVGADLEHLSVRAQPADPQIRDPAPAQEQGARRAGSTRPARGGCSRRSGR